MGGKALQVRVFYYLACQKDWIHENMAVSLKGKILGTKGWKEGNKSQWFEIESAHYQLKGRLFEFLINDWNIWLRKEVIVPTSRSLHFEITCFEEDVL